MYKPRDYTSRKLITLILGLLTGLIILTSGVYLNHTNPDKTNDTQLDGFLKVDSTLSGSTSDGEFRIQTDPTNYSYDYDVEWQNVNNPSDNGSAAGLTEDYTINFDNDATYYVNIIGKIPRIKYDGTLASLEDANKIISIEQWGDTEWQSMNKMFHGARNLQYYNATDNPDLSSVTDMSFMFAGAGSFNGDIGSWDTSNVQNMSGMFEDAYDFNKDIGSWDTSNVQNMSSMFRYAFSFNQDISTWDTSNVQNMSSVFRDANSFSQNISTWCVSQIPSKPDDFDLDAGFDGNRSSQPNWGTSTGC